MIEKINPTIPIPITSSPIPDEQREIIMAKSSIAIPNPIFFIVNPPLQIPILMSLLYHNDTITKKEKELLRALLIQFCKLEFSQFFISVFFLFQLINRPIVEITKINADVREKIPSVTTNMINVANGI